MYSKKKIRKFTKAYWGSNKKSLSNGASLEENMKQG